MAMSDNEWQRVVQRVITNGQKFKSILSKIYGLEIKGAFKILTSSESLTDLLMLYLHSFNERN